MGHSLWQVDDDGNIVDTNRMAASVIDAYDKVQRSHVMFVDDLNWTIDLVLDNVQCEVLRVDLSSMSDVPCPKQYEDTRTSPLKARWDDSMGEEYKALVHNHTWNEVSRNDPRLKGRKPTKSRWVYTIKYNRDGTISRFKSRFVVCGYSQRQGLDYDRAFSATLRATISD